MKSLPNLSLNECELVHSLIKRRHSSWACCPVRTSCLSSDVLLLLLDSYYTDPEPFRMYTSRMYSYNKMMMFWMCVLLEYNVSLDIIKDMNLACTWRELGKGFSPQMMVLQFVASVSVTVPHILNKSWDFYGLSLLWNSNYLMCATSCSCVSISTKKKAPGRFFISLLFCQFIMDLNWLCLFFFCYRLFRAKSVQSRYAAWGQCACCHWRDFSAGGGGWNRGRWG